MRFRFSVRLMGLIVAVGLAGLGWDAAAAAAEPAAGTAPLKGAPPGTAQPVPEVEQAAAIFRRGDPDEALRLLREAVKKHPELSPPQVILATWFSEANQVALARSALEQAVIEAPNDPQAYAMLGETALRARATAEAELLYGKALELMKGAKALSERLVLVRNRSLGGLAATAEARQDWKGAQQHLEALLAESPKDAGALEQLGRVLFQQKKPDEALARFREAAKIDPNGLAPEAMLAQLYQQAGDPQNAGKWMLAAIQASPRDFKIRLAAAQWEFEIGRYDDAEKQAEAALQLDPNALAALMVRGAIAIVGKDY
jgi:tetratricopeptide (TPR) repeat protein